MAQSDSENPLSLKNLGPYHLSAIAWCAVFFVWGLLTLKFHPPVNYNLGDELWAVQLGGRFLAGDFPGGYVTPRAYFSLLAAFFSLTGEGLYAARAFSLIWASMALYLTYRAGTEIAGQEAGLVSSVLLGSTFAFQWHARVVRPETLTALLVLAAFYLVLVGLKRDKGWFVAMGALLIALSIHVHPNNLQYCLGLSAAYVFLAGKKVFTRASVYFGAGMSAGFAAWFFLLYLPAKNTAAIQALSDIGKTHSYPALNKGFFALAMDSAARFPKDYSTGYLDMFNFFFPNSITAYFFAWMAVCVWVLSLLVKGRRQAFGPLFFAASASYLSYFITDRFGYWHLVELYPLLALSTAIGLYNIKSAVNLKLRSTGTALLWLFVAVFAIAGLGDNIKTQADFSAFSYERLLGRVSAAVPDGAKALGIELYRPAFAGRPYAAAWFNFDRKLQDCPPPEQRVRALGVDYIIVDSVFKTLAYRACGANYERTLSRYLNLQCTLVSIVDEQYPNYWARGGMINKIYIYKTPG